MKYKYLLTFIIVIYTLLRILFSGIFGLTYEELYMNFGIPVLPIDNHAYNYYQLQIGISFVIAVLNLFLIILFFVLSLKKVIYKKYKFIAWMFCALLIIELLAYCFWTYFSTFGLHCTDKMLEHIQFDIGYSISCIIIDIVIFVIMVYILKPRKNKGVIANGLGEFSSDSANSSN